MSGTPADFVRIENVSKRFRDVAVVDRVHLHLTRGEFLSLLGPSGCGKTSLLRIIGGFTVPDQGTIRLDGEDITALAPEKRPVNMVFQSYAIFPHLNVADNIGYGLRSGGLTRSERERRVRDALNLISLSGYEQRRADELSGGERQRVALARALVKRPKLLLLDEPLGALDKRLRESMQIELRQIQRETGVTFLFVTHDQDEALAMSDRIAVMDKGRVLQVADPKTLYDAPNSRAVASFIGSMNFLDGRVTGASGDCMSADISGFGPMQLPLRGAGTFAPGDRMIVALRPEKLRITIEAPAGSTATARVLSQVYLGDRSQIRLVLPSIRIPVTATTTATFAGAQPGEMVYLSFDPADAILFPA